MHPTDSEGRDFARAAPESTALDRTTSASTPDNGTIRDQRPSAMRVPEPRDDPDAAGPEEDVTLEIDFIHGRLSMDLEMHGEGEGPELEGLDIARFEIARFPQDRGLTQGDEMGPELDLEHVSTNDELR